MNSLSGSLEGEKQRHPVSVTSSSIRVDSHVYTEEVDVPGDDEIPVPHIDPDGIDVEATHISLRNVEPANVCVRNLSITVNQKKPVWEWRPNQEPAQSLRILNDVSANMPKGQLMAIIGGSGSGKTSMLNVLAERMSGGNISITGSTLYNGVPSLSSVHNAYVMQQDVLLPRLTVRETLQYSAELRLPSGTTQAGRERVVEEVILQLGLKECANTLVGDGAHKGCSGGEKRRVSIGVQLLANPSVLFLDEPTTGLDATSAYQLVRTLKNLAKKGRTIVTTLHQPRSEIWGLFDRITLLTRGNPIYSGTRAGSLPYFAQLGHELPGHINPADFLIDLSAVDYRTPEAETASFARVGSLIDAWRNHESDAVSPVMTQDGAPLTPAITSASQRAEMEVGAFAGAAKPPLWQQINVLTRRTFKTTYRDPMGIAGCLILAAGMGIMGGWIFLKVDKSLSGIRSRQAALYLSCAMPGYLLLLFECYRLCSVDIAIYDREHGEKMVSSFAFLFSRRIAKLITEDIPVPLIFATVFYFMVGFDRTAPQFFVFFTVVLLGQYINVSFATMATAFTRNFSEVVLIANLWYTMQSVACGFFIQAGTMPVYVQWTKYVSYIWYCFGALSVNEFAGKKYDCPFPAGAPQCLEYDGDFVVDSLDYPRDWKAVPLIAAASWSTGFYLIAGLALAWLKVDINVARTRINSESDLSAGKEVLIPSDDVAQATIDLTLDDYKLSLHKPGFFGHGKLDLDILRGMSARFEAGKLNVIMGPSGSGKSSLLNSMAARLHSSTAVKYKSTGKFLFNGQVVPEGTVRALCSYVTQDDDALLPSLTVRETLCFAAALRLPSHMSAAEKKARAEDVMLKLGLKDCADVLVGSEFIKGISGGQRRRVTIAVQILTSPRILLLDEPTSGLDAFTAASILGVLRGLADEGRTVIATIHQSRSDLFEKFGNVLLLARGGHAVYSGSADGMLPYFGQLGHHCPPNTNPADFALDLVTVDLQHKAREHASRITVETLISRYSRDDALQLSPSSPTGSPTTSSAPTRPSFITTTTDLTSIQRTPADFAAAFPILVRRGLINLKRQPPLVVSRIMQVVGLGIVLSLFFAPLGNDYFAVQNRLGYIQQLLPLYFVGMLQNIALYPAERDVFYREHDDHAYGSMAFLGAYIALEIPFELITALLFSLLGGLAVGLATTPDEFFIVAVNTFLVTNCGESVGIIFNTLFTHTGFSVNIMSTFLSISTIMAGIMSSNMPRVLRILNYLSPPKYVAQNLAPYTLEGVVFYCTAKQKLADGTCPIGTGEQALHLYNLDGYVGWKNLVALVGATLVYRVLACTVLVLRRGW